MKYAPHFNMFKNSAGADPIDQLKFAADQGFTAWEDNGMMRKFVELQERIARTTTQLDMTMGVFVSSGDFDRNEFNTSTAKDLQARLRTQMKKAVDVAKRVNAKWSTFVPGEINYRNIFKHIHDKGYRDILGMEHGNSKKGKEGEQAVIEAYRYCDSF